jgi:peptidoglycan hydrolase CwlO-like protein
MHTFLIVCVVILAVMVAVLWRNLAGAVNERLDAIESQRKAKQELLEETCDAIRSQISELEAKLLDIAEGCEKLDSDLSVLTGDVKELVRFRQADMKELNERIAQIVEDQEKARRRSGLRNAPAAFETLRGVAETNAAKRPDPEHLKLVALAEGAE